MKKDLHDEMLDEKKIAFIICVNDEVKYEECRYYLRRLHIPGGYVLDIIDIREAPSMAAGYNAAMESSDAKYKVYLHQDVYIKNTDFVADMLDVFACDQKIGMLGMIGKKEMGKTVFDMMDWDIGGVIYDYEIMSWNNANECCFEEAALLDGLLLATQYDIPWRADVFDGWDFYDASQCMEFRKAGYRIVVPHQKEIWCCHDGVYSDLTTYFDYYERFVHEYAGVMGGVGQSEREHQAAEENKKFVYEMKQLKKCIEELMNLEGKEELRKFFAVSDIAKIDSLREYGDIIRIDQLEEQNQSLIRLWNTGMTALQLLAKLRILKCALKRMEYDTDDLEEIRIKGIYSKYAMIEMCNRYAVYKDKLYKKMKDCF